MSPSRAASWKTRRPPGIAGRAGPRPDQETNAVRLRLAWEELAGKVRAACSLGGAHEDPDTLLTLQHLVARTGRADPPFEAAPVRTAAAGFRLLAEAWIQSHPDRRAAMADAMIAGARLVDGFLTEERMRAAQGWQRQFAGD